MVQPGKLEASVRCRNSLIVRPLPRSDPMQCLQMDGFKTPFPVLALSSSEVSYLKMTSAPTHNSPFTVSASLHISRGQVSQGSAGLKKGALHWGCLWFLFPCYFIPVSNRLMFPRALPKVLQTSASSHLLSAWDLLLKDQSRFKHLHITTHHITEINSSE